MVLLLSTARKDPVEDEFSRVINALSALIREIDSIGVFVFNGMQSVVRDI